DPSSWNPWMRLLEINDRLKDTASQRTEAAQAMELFPSQPSAYLYYGQLMLRQKRWKEAIEPLSTGASYVTDDRELEVQFYWGLIEAFDNQNKPDRADDYYEKILRLQPENTKAALGYATSLTDRNVKPVKAEELAQLVLNKEPDNAAAMEVLAWSKYQLGSYQDAKLWMEKSLAKNPKSARANERMGDIQHLLSNDTEAVRYWKKAREIGGANAALDRKIERRKLDNEE
ncbi:MAG: tetratricopeptide repeat protein, partial [Bacteroidia bacterium]